MSFNVNTFNSDNWHRDAPSIARRNQIKTRRWGMRVTVYLTGSAGDYVLSYGLASTDLQDNNNWLKVADIGDTWGGGGGAVTADNGLTATGSNVQLGGLLIQNTIIDGDAAYSFRVTNADNISLDCGNYLELIGGTSGVNLSGTGQTLINSLDSVGITGPSVAAVGQAFGINFTAVFGKVEFEATNDEINFIAGEFQLQSLAAISGTTQFFAGDGSWRYALGQALDGNVTSPTAGEDGYVLSWNDANQEYELVPQGGGGVTADNGLNESGGNIQLGGPLTEDTLINGGTTFDLIFGTFITNPLGAFQVYAQDGIFFSNRDGSGNTTGFTVGSGGANLAMSTGPFLAQNTVNVASSLDLYRFQKSTAGNTDVGPIMSFSAKTSGTAAAGFGTQLVFVLENAGGNDDTAAIEQYTWAVATDNANYANYKKQLRINDVMTDVWQIVTSSVAPNIFTTLFGRINMPNLPTSAAGLAAGDLWNNSGVVNIV